MGPLTAEAVSGVDRYPSFKLKASSNFKMGEENLEGRVSALEDKIFGDLDKNEQYTKATDVILGFNSRMGNVLGDYERAVMIMKRLEELESYLDPLYGQRAPPVAGAAAHRTAGGRPAAGSRLRTGGGHTRREFAAAGGACGARGGRELSARSRDHMEDWWADRTGLGAVSREDADSLRKDS
ncbi:uncharacterized protein LOC122366458 isoform X2 [Amphibalanus amphitrite]|uniref:uncharacterized protein LOC122366458 isoform X2 n=1 Tax=Amphibalanus amphitrite TaxID=1232801 RepID=UPI001C9242B4|nr:uncharacterized protein LOC122366458 isoform X2 [Amphibalanus amphitrite]